MAVLVTGAGADRVSIQGIARRKAIPPYRNRTFRQPPNQGERTVALNMDPVKKPKAMPIDRKPLARPICWRGNQFPHILKSFMTTNGDSRPNRNMAAVIDSKLLARPREAPASPASRQLMTMMRLGPKRSPAAPATKPVKMPGRELIPHTRPSWTRLRFKSRDISLNKTGMHIDGAATASVFVRVAKVRIYHR